MKTWWKEAVVYQIYPRSFKDTNGDGIGDLRGIIEKLDYIKSLGVDVVWLNPIYSSPNDDNGYDISDYQNIMEEFGTMNDFDELLEGMHERGIKLIMDLVVNHTSDEHPWFIESKKGKDSPYRDYYIWKDGKGDNEPNNWGSVFSGSAWDKVDDQYYLHCFTKKQPDLNWENENMRQDVYDMMRFWLDKGVDGFRMDVINAISKATYDDAKVPGDNLYGDVISVVWNNPKVHDYLHEMYESVLKHYDIMTVGETSRVTPEIADLYVREDRQELNMVFQFEHMKLDTDWCKWVERDWQLPELKEILSKWQTDLDKNSWNSLYWNNHDQARVVSRFGNDKDFRRESATMLATLLHMMRGTPYIYQGEEIGMTNIYFDKLSQYKDVEIHNGYKQLVETGKIPHDQFMDNSNKYSRDHSRTPMQWDDSTYAGFSDSKPWIEVNPNKSSINVEAALKDDKSIFYYYRNLIQLRKKHEVIVYGDYVLLEKDHDSLFVYKRRLGDEKILVICNFHQMTQTYHLPDDILSDSLEILINNYEDFELKNEVNLRPYEAVVIKY
ncbi:alpha-glucosidase [Acidaminobacter sp. JC074]|uniref:glycoside hydrolase family 13 protein n=1 Tax=Acidaminobacter sp. JC074 TaxID=2530199 RepID=UPI001F0D7DC6|nr:alpha-glucosidase [Acidaminobacter sp. JC074]MCH4891429.1 alpha-glucosidase [Acidaminobacter sp. JC074]